MLATTAHFEHGLPLLASLDLGRLFDAYAKLEANKEDMSAIKELIGTITVAAELKTLRKLSAVYRATADELFDSESDAAILVALEKAAAARPFTDSIQDAMAFFASLGLSKEVIPDYSSAPSKAKKKKPAIQAVTH